MSMASKSKLAKPKTLRQPTQFGYRQPAKSGISSQASNTVNNKNLKKISTFKKENTSDQKENEVVYDCNENQKNVPEPSKFLPKPRTMLAFSKLKTPTRRIGHLNNNAAETKANNHYGSNEKISINTSDGVIITRKSAYKKNRCMSPPPASLSAKKDVPKDLIENPSHTGSNQPSKNLKFKPMNMKSFEGDGGVSSGNCDVDNLLEGRKRYVEARKQLNYAKDNQSISAKKIGRAKIAKPVVRPVKKTPTPEFIEKNFDGLTPDPPHPISNGLSPVHFGEDKEVPIIENGFLKSGMFHENEKHMTKANIDDQFVEPQTPPSSLHERLQSGRTSVNEESCDGASDVELELPLSLCSERSYKRSGCSSVNSFNSEDASESMDVFNTRNNSLLESKRKSRLKGPVSGVADGVKFDQMMEDTREFKNLLLSLYKQLKAEENEKNSLKLQIKTLQAGGNAIITKIVPDRKDEIESLQKNNKDLQATLSKLNDENSTLKSENEVLRKEIDEQNKSGVKTSDASTNTLPNHNEEILNEAYHVIHDLQEKLKGAISTNNQIPDGTTE